MIYCFDLDGTLCTHEKNYEDAKPMVDRINLLNTLYDDGNTIIIDTARGSTTKIDWFKITQKQLHQWGVKYHELRVGIKFNFDFLIDDKAINDKDFFKK
jgi:hypothetical protein